MASRVVGSVSTVAAGIGAASMKGFGRGAGRSAVIGAAAVTILGHGAASVLSSPIGHTFISFAGRAVGHMRPDLFGRSPWAIGAILSRVIGGMLSSAAGSTELSASSKASGQTSGWLNASHPIAEKIIELEGRLVRVVELKGKLVQEVDLSGDI
jgi:hypothetical protein